MTRLPPEDCRSMVELRQQVDDLDRALVLLLSERSRFIDRAAALKMGEGLPARIGPRVEEVVKNVRTVAATSGMDADLAERLWRQLIEWSIEREEVVLGADAI